MTWHVEHASDASQAPCDHEQSVRTDAGITSNGGLLVRRVACVAYFKVDPVAVCEVEAVVADRPGDIDTGAVFGDVYDIHARGESNAGEVSPRDSSWQRRVRQRSSAAGAQQR
jgi:hypothetical protein